jgi:AcrR family transcriptional regulator
MAEQGTTRRERVRQATLVEIRSTARRLLVEQGSAAVTINAVAREMGMSGPAVYRYYSGHEELVETMTADYFGELTDTLTTVRQAHRDAPPARRLLRLCRALRQWAIEHPAEFGWIFADKVPASQRDRDSVRQAAGDDFQQVFLEEVAELWESTPFPVPRLADLDPSLQAQLRNYAAVVDHRLPPEALHVFLTCWIRLYGLLCMEVMHQLDFAYTDPEPLFEQCLRDLTGLLALPYAPPSADTP